MRTVSLRLVDMAKATIPLGFEGENEFSVVRIDCKKVYDQYPGAVPTLSVTDPAGNKYPAVITRDGNIVEWQVSASDLTKEGYGEIQIAFVIDDTVIGKSDIAKTKIKRSITPSGETPTPIENFITEAGAIVQRIPNDIADALEAAKESGEFDGYSPTVQITAIPGGNHVVITDVDGEHPYNVLDGKDGQNGKDGQDGQDGQDGADGDDGATYTPAVSEAGVLSWTNDGGRQNPPPVDIAGAVRGVIDETVSGATPAITGQANRRYLCGEVETITITPPQTGIIDVIFTSGTTPAILTVPNTVRFPEWFDSTDLAADTTYEINIVDGVYGAVMSWT